MDDSLNLPADYGMLEMIFPITFSRFCIEVIMWDANATPKK